MTRSLVVPIIGPDSDPEGASLVALPIARELVELLPLDVEIVLISVLDLPSEATDTGEPRVLDASGALPDTPYNATMLENAKRRTEQLVTERQSWLEEVAGTFPRGRTRAVMRYGDAAIALLQFVATLDDPLVVMASHARRGVRRLILGSVASAMVMRGDSPVLVVPVHAAPVDEKFALRHVLVPLDGSLLAEQALDDLDRIGLTGLPLHLVHVLDASDAIAREDARRYLESVAQRRNDAGRTTGWSVRRGEVAGEIAAAARECDADLIVMATRGLGGLRRVVLGSVAERVVHESVIPVLLMRPDEDRLRRQRLLAESSTVDSS